MWIAHLARAAVLAVVVASSVLIAPSSASASVVETATPTALVNGTVYATLQVGDKTYIAGEFTRAGGENRLNAAVLLADGSVGAWNPAPNGRIRALAVSADQGTIYVGGSFSAVGATTRKNLAAVTADTGDVVAKWRANALSNGGVLALARVGNSLYVGGYFAKIDNQIVSRLAKVSATGVQTGLTADLGDVDTSFAPSPDASIRTLQVTVKPEGVRLYAGGGFNTIAGVSRPGIAELDGSGAATSFAPTTGGVVITSGISPDGSRVFFATTSNRTYPYDPAVSNVPPYIVRTGGDVQAIAVGLSDADGSGHPDEVYVGGHFTQFQEPAKATRPKIGSFSYDTGLPTSWAPVIDSYYGVWAMTATPDYLVVGGAFTTVDGVAQRGIARFAGTP